MLSEFGFLPWKWEFLGFGGEAILLDAGSRRSILEE
jgi:hypothetical protein